MVSRREILGALGGLGLGGAGVWGYQSGALAEATGGAVDAGGDSTPSGPQLVYDFGPFSGPFDRLEWAGGQAEISFKKGHDADGWAFYHEDQSGYEEALAGGPAPEFDGSIVLNALRQIRKEGVEFPSNRWKLSGYRGRINDVVFLVEDKTGTVTFQIPPDRVPGNVRTEE